MSNILAYKRLRAHLCSQFSPEKVRTAVMIFCATITFMFSAAAFSREKAQKWAEFSVIPKGVVGGVSRKNSHGTGFPWYTSVP